MGKFLKKLLVFVIVFFLFDKLFYPFLLISPGLEKDTRLEKIITGEMNKDIIVLGSSRGARSIIACQIADSLHFSAYNLSYPGSDIEFHEFLLKSLLKFNKKPKMVLLTVDDPFELLPTDLVNFRYDVLYPLAKYDYINNEMISRGSKNFLSRMLVLARINKRNFDIRERYFTAMDTVISCGSMPVSFQRKDRPLRKYDASEQRYQIKDEMKNKVAAFLRLRDLCFKNHIKLVLILPPTFKRKNYQFENRIRQLSLPETSLFVYDTTKAIYRDKSYFYDESHLQKKGSVIFTDEVIGFLKGSK